MKIIGLAGKAGSGKDTAAAFIVEWAAYHGLTAKRDAFADRLKQSAAASFGAPGDPVEFCNKLKQTGVTIIVIGQPDRGTSLPPTLVRTTGRKFLQDFGTEGHRDVFGSEFWVEALFDSYDKRRPDNNPDILVIPDCRFPNEIDAVHNRNGKVWELQGRASEDVPQHISETEALDTDLTLDNGGGMGQLRSLIFATAGRELGYEPSYA
jgi:hypothetical protein